jgi:hypothetical protein
MPSATTGSLPSLATPDDIVARLGRNLNQVEALRVDAMLQDGSAIIRRYARNTFTYMASDTITIAGDDGKFVLPGRPIHSVDSVTALFGYLYLPEYPVTWFVFDGIDTVTIPEPLNSGIINLPYFIFYTGWYCYSYRVVYTHGYTDVPDDIKGMLCSAIISELATPTMSATLQSESIGAYSYSMRRSVRASGSGASSGPQAGMYAALIDFGMLDLLADYRRKQGTIGVRR